LPSFLDASRRKIVAKQILILTLLNADWKQMSKMQNAIQDSGFKIQDLPTTNPESRILNPESKSVQKTINN
jgi:hypothetical protein